ncbi:MAG: cupin domain-containing protein [Caldilineaceae bacterium]
MERCGYVLEGEVQLQLDGQTTTLTPGGYAHLPPDTPQ